MGPRTFFQSLGAATSVSDVTFFPNSSSTKGFPSFLQASAWLLIHFVREALFSAPVCAEAYAREMAPLLQIC